MAVVVMLKRLRFNASQVDVARVVAPPLSVSWQMEPGMLPLSFPDLLEADEKRAEVFPRTSRRRISADDEFLLVHALQFDPRPAAPSRFINGVALLPDDPFGQSP